MIEDPIVQPASSSAQYGHDLARIVQVLRRRERESDRLLLNPGPNVLNRERPEAETPIRISPDAKWAERAQRR